MPLEVNPILHTKIGVKDVVYCPICGNVNALKEMWTPMTLCEWCHRPMTQCLRIAHPPDENPKACGHHDREEINIVMDGMTPPVLRCKDCGLYLL